MRLIVDELPEHAWNCLFNDDYYYYNCSFTKNECPLENGGDCPYLTSFYAENTENNKEC